VASLIMSPKAEETETAAALRRLAASAEELSFAVMQAEEDRLCVLGLAVIDPDSGTPARLGGELSGLYIDPAMTRISFRVH
jgi:hypothetical protein